MRRGFPIFGIFVVAVIAACTAGVVGEKEDFEAEPRQALSKAKGEGGENFDWSYCNGDELCGEGEGDCDNDAHCAEGLVCRRNVGKHFGVDERIDVCLPQDWEPTDECELGGCTPVCKADEVLCDGKCTNIKKDRNNCGGCDLVCPAETICGGNGFCKECEGDLLVCGNSCVDTETDSKNCGGCGQICPQKSVCVDAACCNQRACGDDECGMVDDGCGGQMDCGKCPNICEGHCGGAASVNETTCYCDNECAVYGDCCQDAEGGKGKDRSYVEEACGACEPKKEICNNLDDDCDGVLDNGDDLCAEGAICYYGMCWKENCEKEKELCNGLDDNCDGLVDNGDNLCPAGEACFDGACLAVKPCTVEVNGVVIMTVQALDRNDCYKQTSFGSANCSTYAKYFVSGENLLEQYFDGWDRVNSDTCAVP